MKRVVVNYEVISGDWSAQSVRSFRLGGKDPKEVIHSYFQDFWGEETVTDTYGARYHHTSWEQAIKISSIREVNDEEIAVLEKLGI